jgi:DNA-binding response OmpR family regulator
MIYVQQRPVCVVLDLDIHGTAALDVCHKIRGQPEASDTTILLLTAQRSVECFDAALLAGADDILLKPLADAELIERVEGALNPARYTGEELRRRCERLCQQRAQLEAEATRCVSIAG